MIRRAFNCSGSLLLVVMTACTPTWNHTTGAQTLPSSHVNLAPAAGAAPETDIQTGGTGRTAVSSPVALVVPAGWHWFNRGDDLIATKDGVFLQQIFIERIHIDQVKQDVTGAFPLAVLSSKQWSTRTVESLKKRFTAGMLPADSADVLLVSRRNDPKVTELHVRKVVTRTIADRQAFRAVFDFRLKDSVLKPSPLYRSVYCGFMLDDWFYGFSYTAALRYYFEKDADTFEVFLDSIRLVKQ
jgi:hypothetical protein